MYSKNYKSERGFLLIILIAVAAIIFVAAVLFTTGVIETEQSDAANDSCEILRKRCENSCDNDSNCKSDCLITYQQCIKEKAG